MASLALNKFLILYGANTNLMTKFLQYCWVKCFDSMLSASQERVNKRYFVTVHANFITAGGHRSAQGGDKENFNSVNLAKLYLILQWLMLGPLS